MVALDVLVVTTALDAIRADLHASIEELEWTVNAYNLSFAVLLMTGAVLGDRLGRRRVFVAGLAVFTAASVACAFAPGIGWLVAARAVQGVGAALIVPLSLALLAEAFPPERRGRALGLFSGITGLAVLGGPVVGGAIAQGLAWEWIFWLNVPVGLLAIPLVWRRIDESYGPPTPFDLTGMVLLGASALGVVWALVRGNQAGWGSAEVLCSLAAGALLLVAFVRHERRRRAPMLPLGLFRSRAFAAGNAATLLLFASLFGAVFFMAQFLQVAQGYGPLEAGLRMLPWTATLFLVAPIAGTLVDRVGERPFVVGGLLLQAAGMAWLALVAAPDAAYPELVPGLVLAGCGVSMAMPANQSAVLRAAPPSQLGTASGAFSMLRQLGGVLGVAVAVAVFTAAGSVTSPQAFVDGFGAALGVASALSIGAAVAAAIATTRTRRAPSPDGAAAGPARPTPLPGGAR
jgi:EmrB/QacA subfamily drug resistance transporter